MNQGTDSAQRIRIGIVDDHIITRQGLREFLIECEGFEVVAEGSNGRDAMDMARNVQLDVMLLDIDMPGQSGLDCFTHVRARAPELGVLMLSSHPVEQYGVAMIRKGASGYLNKGCEPEEIVTAIRVVAAGRRYINPELSAALIDNVSSTTHGDVPHAQLTAREFQLMVKLARGTTTEEAARQLSLSPKTVSSYRVHILDKLGLRTNSEMTYYALKHKLID